MAKTSQYLRTCGWWMTVANAAVTLALLTVAFVSTVFFGPAATRVLPGLLLTFALILWTQSAYSLLLWLLRRGRDRSAARSTITSIASVAVAGWSAIVVVDAFLFRPDPQSALILLFLPVVQWVAVAIILMADAVTVHIESRSETRTRWAVLKTRLVQLLLAVAVAFGGWWLFQRPSNERTWVPNLAILPRSTFQGDTVTIHNIRNTIYRSVDDYTPAYYERVFDLKSIESVDFIVVPFQGLAAAAHTFVIFGFDGGQRVAISVEVRREREESYSPLRGMLRQCELIYVIADERDVILSRTRYWRDRVYLYPIRASRENIRNMFISMLHRANRLRTRPEFYNTLTNNCTSNILRHFNHVNERKLPASLNILFPGYSDRLVYDLGLIDRRLTFDRLQRQSEISEKANRFADDPRFSQRIRE